MLLKLKSNPSSWGQRIGLSLISAVAMLIAIHMGLYQWGLIDTVFDPVFGRSSEWVLTSEAAHHLRAWIRLPDAILGAIAYLGDIIFALAGSVTRWKDRPWLVLLFGLYVIPPALVSIILVIIQGTILNSWCFLCLVTATISVGLILLAYKEVAASLLFLGKVWQQSRSPLLVWQTFSGTATRAAITISQEMERSYVGPSS